MEHNPPGVFSASKKDGTIYYRASITHKKKHISLGSYPTALLAYGAYLEGTAILDGESLTITDYSCHRILPFAKWICLINYRDNRIYFANPIYIRKNYFEYYLSEDLILKFDIDDLFYYSSHKIMVRGRHFFVSDYGMQVNILNRYGIKNYAVKDRDYRFVNDDDLDFRYDNIEIFNIYHGVTRKNTKKGIRYVAKIHIKGNYTIGIYESDIEAAIAYNKAIDLLKKAGVNKNFSVNYLENLSPSAYADIYSKLHISSKITNYLRV
ncbi:hypothetical protein C819_00176 [Lachnospiraceae bacterium 10-1]|nr:hypothetical protein C819_00176 [Lachnospiraceae bacterium 10-1]